MLLNHYDRPHLVARRDFDYIPRRSEVAVAPAQPGDFDFLAAMASQKVPGINVPGSFLSAFAARDPDSILSFRFKGELVGGVAFLFLNEAGVEALFLDTMNFAAPSTEMLANPIEDVIGVYIWATALDGRGILGLGNVSEHLSKRRFYFADLYGRPNTDDGRRLVRSVGFKREASFQQDDLWIYRRAWKRTPHAAIDLRMRGYGHVQS